MHWRWPGHRISARNALINKGSTLSILYLEDFTPGQRCAGHTSIRIKEDRIKTFASKFDPQPFHPDEAAAKASIFGGLAASGWHAASVTMRLVVDSEFKPASGIIAAGFDELHLPRPVRSGDKLGVETEVLDVRPSKSQVPPRTGADQGAYE